MSGIKKNTIMENPNEVEVNTPQSINVIRSNV